MEIKESVKESLEELTEKLTKIPPEKEEKYRKILLEEFNGFIEHSYGEDAKLPRQQYECLKQAFMAGIFMAPGLQVQLAESADDLFFIGQTAMKIGMESTVSEYEENKETKTTIETTETAQENTI